MPQELFEAIKYGGAVAIILAIGWLLTQVNAIIGNRNGNTNGKKISLSEYSDLSEKITNLGDNHLHEVRDSLNLLREDMNRNFVELNRKLEKFNDGFIWVRSRLNGKEQNNAN